MSVQAIPTTGIETVAGFIGERHPAYVLQFWPPVAESPRAHVVYLPPFAEEMNRCRSLVAAQARCFAGTGLSCSVLDFYGTGESPGDLLTASLGIWRNNIGDLIEGLLRCAPAPVYLWGFRLGALLALDYMSHNPGVVRKLLLWQPLTSGRSFVTQMLRQRTASLVQKGESPETGVDIRSRIAAGEPLEVAGYQLGGELLAGIDQLEMDSMLQAGAVNQALDILWLEHAVDEVTMPGARSERAIACLKRSGAQVTVEPFTGDPVWRLHKRGNCDELLRKTRSLAL